MKFESKYETSHAWKCIRKWRLRNDGDSVFIGRWVKNTTMIPLWCWDRNSTWRDDVIKWKHFPRYWPFVKGIHRSPVDSPHNGQWRGALMFSLICAWTNGWANTRDAGYVRRHRAHYDVTIMKSNLAHLFLDKLLPLRRRHFQMHFHNEDICTCIQISLKIGPMGPNDNA